MIEWVKLSSVIIDQIFNYGPKIHDILKEKSNDKKKKLLQSLSNKIVEETLKDLLRELKKLMDYSISNPLPKEEIEKLTETINSIIKNEQAPMHDKMKDIIITQMYDLMADNLLFVPKYQNILIIGSDNIYKFINNIFKDDTTFQGDYDQFQFFCTKKPDFRAGLLLYAFNLQKEIDKIKSGLSTPPPPDDKINAEMEKKLKNVEDEKKRIVLIETSNQIIRFIKKQNIMYENDLQKKINNIALCVNSDEEFEDIKNLIVNLNRIITKQNLKINLYLIINNDYINKAEIDKQIQEMNNNNDKTQIKIFDIPIVDQNEDFDDENEKEIETFLNEIVNEFITEYVSSNQENIINMINSDFQENYKMYCDKLSKEFNQAVKEMADFKLSNIPLKVEYEAHIKRIFFDIFINHIFPITNKDSIKDGNDHNNNISKKLSNESISEIDKLFKFNLENVQKLTEKAKIEYNTRLIAEVKQKLNELFEKSGFKDTDKDNKNILKESFLDNITTILNEKINSSSDIYNICLAYLYINSDMFKILNEKCVDFCLKNILENDKFKEEINKRMTQQIDSLQRKVLDIH